MKRVSRRKKRLRLKIKVFAKILVVLLLIGLIVYIAINKKTKNIYIKGNSFTKDVDIIRSANLQNYPKLIKINRKEAINNITSLPMIKSAKISINPFGKVTITVEERNNLFYYKYTNKIVTSDNTQIDDIDSYVGYPTLINFTPDTTLEALVKGLNKININIIKMINEIEYDPYKSQEGEIIDENRFKLLMNDGNTVYIDTANIKRLNQYLEIFASLNMETTKGILYLDTITEDNILFESYESHKETNEAIENDGEEKEEKDQKEEPPKPINEAVDANNGEVIVGREE